MGAYSRSRGRKGRMRATGVGPGGPPERNTRINVHDTPVAPRGAPPQLCARRGTPSLARPAPPRGTRPSRAWR
eukprot:2061555-Prymnesium_polylepis.1